MRCQANETFNSFAAAMTRPGPNDFCHWVPIWDFYEPEKEKPL
jgi:hypothetical protein